MFQYVFQKSYFIASEVGSPFKNYRNVMKLILIRHGETEINRGGLTHITRDEAGLTSEGKKQVLKNLPKEESFKYDFENGEAVIIDY